MAVVQSLLKYNLIYRNLTHIVLNILILSSVSLNTMKEFKMCSMSNWFSPMLFTPCLSVRGGREGNIPLEKSIF